MEPEQSKTAANSCATHILHCCPLHLIPCWLQTLHQPCGTACLWLGQLAERGFGLPAPDYTEAAAWYGRGAALGHLECALALAFYYQHGLGKYNTKGASDSSDRHKSTQTRT